MQCYDCRAGSLGAHLWPYVAVVCQRLEVQGYRAQSRSTVEVWRLLVSGTAAEEEEAQEEEEHEELESEMERRGHGYIAR